MVVAKVASTSTFEYLVGQQSHNKVHTQKTINGFVKSNYMTRKDVDGFRAAKKRKKGGGCDCQTI